MTKIATADKFVEASRAYARHLASLPTVAIGYMKKHLVASHNSTLGQILDLEAVGMAECMGTEDHRGAVQAFLNKTQPEFRGQ